MWLALNHVLLLLILSQLHRTYFNFTALALCMRNIRCATVREHMNGDKVGSLCGFFLLWTSQKSCVLCLTQPPVASGDFTHGACNS